MRCRSWSQPWHAMRPDIARPATLVWLAAGLNGCWTSELLEAPLVLAGGLASPDVLTAISRDQLAVVTQAGVFQVGLDGTVSALDKRIPRAIAAHPDRLYLLIDDTVHSRPPADGGPLKQAGVQDMTAWCDGQVMLLTTDKLILWNPGEGSSQPWTTAPPASLRIAVGTAEGCESALVGTSDGAILQVTVHGATPLATGIAPIHSVSSDGLGRVWALHGRPTALSEIRDGNVHTLTDHLGDSVDLFVLPAPAGNAQHAYITDPAGSVDMVQLPSVKEPASP